MLDSKPGSEKIQDEPGTFCGVRTHGHTQNMMGASRKGTEVILEKLLLAKVGICSTTK